MGVHFALSNRMLIEITGITKEKSVSGKYFGFLLLLKH
jgi:hypothetical protein